MQTETRHGQPCYCLATDSTELAVTRQGGHMAPVVFFADTNAPVSPYYISPWQDERVELDSPVLRPLRGDLFCMPFGGSRPDGVEVHPPHGETATAEWECLESRRRGSVATLRLGLTTTVRPGRVTCEHTLVEGQSCIYTRHTVEGFSGPVPLGHHATLSACNGPLAIRSAPLLFGMTSPRTPPWMRDGEYGSLAPLERFDALDRVPTIWKDPAFTDCSVFPAREGFVDILQIYQRPSESPGWVTALCREGGYLWFALKRTAQLPSTVFWIENRGRHSAPWSGRNTCLGLEDVCGYFAEGLEASVQPNVINAQGIPTSLELDGTPVAIPYIQGVVRVGAGFDAVAEAVFDRTGVTFVAASGQRAHAAVQLDFLDGQDL